MNFHVKYGVCGSKMAELLHFFKILSKFYQNSFRLSIRTSMQNLESVAQKMAELLHNYVMIANYKIYFVCFSKFGQFEDFLLPEAVF